MTANTNRFSTYTSVSAGSDGKDGEKKKDMWSAMLDSVASGKRLPEKNLLVLGKADGWMDDALIKGYGALIPSVPLGGSVESQRDFLEALSSHALRRNLDRQGAKFPPNTNQNTQKNTYYDVLDADQEGLSVVA